MIELNDFEKAMAKYIWPSADEDMMKDNVVGGVIKNQAAEILEIAKKELYGTAISAKIESKDYGTIRISPLLLKALIGFHSGERVKIIIYKYDENRPSFF